MNYYFCKYLRFFNEFPPTSQRFSVQVFRFVVCSLQIILILRLFGYKGN